jgi:hypothetical protein
MTIETFIRVVKCESELLSHSRAHGREAKEATFDVSPMGITWEVCKSRATRAAIAPERGESSREIIRTLKAAVGHGAGWQAMKCEVCTESDKKV